MAFFKLGYSLVESGKLGMQSLDFLVMRIGSNSFLTPLYTHESLPCCAHAFVNPVCGWKRKNPRRTWADRRALRHRLMPALAVVSLAKISDRGRENCWSTSRAWGQSCCAPTS
jgi:hypothetical protein